METKRLTIPAAEELLGLYFPVLDHGYVSLVDYMGGDASIDDAARTSYGAGTNRVHERRGLLRYLRRQMHTSPIEMVELKFHCAMPIFVARQWIRHRMASVNEYSARYSVMPMLFYTPDRSVVGEQSINNRQGRGEALNDDDFDEYTELIERAHSTSQQIYEKLISMGVARETARSVLPVDVYTQWYWKIDLHNLLHFLTLRADPHAQLEIRVYANILVGMVKRLVPHMFEAWVDYTFAGARFSRQEILAITSFMNSPAPKSFDSLESSACNYITNQRELDEFKMKLVPKEVPNFDLDLSLAKTPEFFAQKWADAVPLVDCPKAK